MQLTRVSVPISVDVREALRKLAKSERRDPREQVRFLITEALHQRGFLPANGNGAGIALTEVSSSLTR